MTGLSFPPPNFSFVRQIVLSFSIALLIHIFHSILASHLHFPDGETQARSYNMTCPKLVELSVAEPEIESRFPEPVPYSLDHTASKSKDKTK